MKRLIVSGVLALALLGLLGLRYPSEENTLRMSAVVLCEAEGRALLLSSGTETWAVSNGTRADMSRLAQYLDAIGKKQLDLLLYTGEATDPSRLLSTVHVKQTVTPGAGERAQLSLADTFCSFEASSGGALALTVQEGAYTFFLDRDTASVRLQSKEGIETITPDRFSVRILLTDNEMTYLPEFSAWD